MGFDWFEGVRNNDNDDNDDGDGNGNDTTTAMATMMMTMMPTLTSSSMMAKAMRMTLITMLPRRDGTSWKRGGHNKNLLFCNDKDDRGRINFKNY